MNKKPLCEGKGFKEARETHARRMVPAEKLDTEDFVCGTGFFLERMDPLLFRAFMGLKAIGVLLGTAASAGCYSHADMNFWIGEGVHDLMQRAFAGVEAQIILWVADLDQDENKKGRAAIIEMAKECSEEALHQL